VFENSGMKRLFGPKLVEMAGGWRKQHIGGPYNFCSSPSIIILIKLSWMQYSGHVARMVVKKLLV
jgi:hypothetical protein